MKHPRTRNGYLNATRDFYKSMVLVTDKGRPPFLTMPLVPLNMVPFNSGSDWVFAKNKYLINEFKNY